MCLAASLRRLCWEAYELAEGGHSERREEFRDTLSVGIEAGAICEGADKE